MMLRGMQKSTTRRQEETFLKLKIVSWRFSEGEQTDSPWMFAVINMNGVADGSLYKDAVTMATLIQGGR